MNNVKQFPEYVRDHINDKNLEPLKQFLRAMSAAEILQGLKEIDPRDLPVVFRLLPKDLATEVFDLMDVGYQSELIESFTSDEAVQLLGALDPDDRVHLLDELPATVAKRLLEQLPKDQRELTAQLMGYEDDTVGRIMMPLYIDVKKQMTVAEAIDRIRTRKNGGELTVNVVYVTDETRKLEGAVPVGKLITADPKTTIESLIKDHQPTAVSTADHQEKAARLLQDLDVLELPVLDRENRLVGVLSVDDAMDVLREEVTDDMFDKAGLLDLTTRESDRSRGLIEGSFMHVSMVRIPFLLLTLAGGMLAGAVIAAFEDTLEAVVATAIFIPVIMDMGGNAGTQSSTIFTRAVVLGQISIKRFVRHWLREVINGVGIGVILGVLGGLVAGLWQGMPELGWAVGFSLTLTVTIAVALGFLIPFALIKLGFDQAAGSDPIITTIKDISGLMIYFTAVALFLPQVV